MNKKNFENRNIGWFRFLLRPLFAFFLGALISFIVTVIFTEVFCGQKAQLEISGKILDTNDRAATDLTIMIQGKGSTVSDSKGRFKIIVEINKPLLSIFCKKCDNILKYTLNIYDSEAKDLCKYNLTLDPDAIKNGQSVGHQIILTNEICNK